ncbi:MAG: DUF3501 family protein [Acidobacteriota bacterium]|nr:DUF3501 family protein [Acidobacteriota bacterium]
MARDPGPGREEPRRPVRRGPQAGGGLTAAGGAGRKLRLEDIEDLRAYERGREAFRGRIIETKRLRRVPVGPIVTVVFENRDTIRFQVQEMARIEKMATDEQIQGELDVYNPIIPEPGELSATLFVELTDEVALRKWLPALVGVERSVVLRLGEGETAEELRSVPEDAHEEQLTRPDVTASVHYVRFALSPAQVARFAAGPAALGVDHPAYRHETGLGDEVRRELLADLAP